MKFYNVKFDCLMPCEITTIIEAENDDEIMQKIIDNEFENFMYKTKGKMYNMSNLSYSELKF